MCGQRRRSNYLAPNDYPMNAKKDRISDVCHVFDTSDDQTHLNDTPLRPATL
jgi:hypothetical protein